MNKMKLHLRVLARLNAEGRLKNLHFDRLPLNIKNQIFNDAMNRKEDEIEAFYLGLAERIPTRRKIGF